VGTPARPFYTTLPVFEPRSADSQPKSIGLVWGLAATRRSVCIHQIIGVRAIFGGGWIDFARKIWGIARKMNSRTNVIKQDETRKLDYIDCGKSLKNLYLHLGYIVLLSSIFVKHAPNSHFRCPKNCSIARKKIILPDSGGCSSYAYASNEPGELSQ